MEQFKVNAVNLKAANLGENDKMLTLFSYEKGMILAKIKGVKKAQAKLKFAQEPFCFGEYILYGGRSGFTVINCTAADLFYDLRSSIEKYYAGCVMLEYCLAFLEEENPDPALFKLLVSCLNSLCYGQAREENILLYFLIKALAVSGYSFEFARCCLCGNKLEQRVFIDLAQGGACCSECGGDMRKAISPAAYKSLKFMSEADLDRLSTINIGYKEVSAALGVLVGFIEEVAGGRIKSFHEYVHIKAQIK